MEEGVGAANSCLLPPPGPLLSPALSWPWEGSGDQDSRMCVCGGGVFRDFHVPGLRPA